MRSIKAVAIVASAFIMIGCSSPSAYMVSVSNKSWCDAAEVAFYNTDTTSLRSIGIAYRYNSDLPTSVIPLDIVITERDSCRTTEHIEICHTASSRLSAVARVASVPWLCHARLYREGEYRFTITPTEPISGIEAVGITISTEDNGER